MNEKCFAKKTVPSRSGDCICLDGNCPGYTQCPFYKPVWKFQHDTEKRYARLETLTEDMQRHISTTYYKGMMPWRRDIE